MNKLERILHEFATPILVLDALRLLFPTLSNAQLKEAWKRRDVKVNGVRASEDRTVSMGDVVTLFTPAAERSIATVYEDEHLLVVNKPHGISSVSDHPWEWTALRCAQGHSPSARLCHRLDHQTSGLLLLAKTDAAYQALYEMIKRRAVDKTYQCLCRGQGRWDGVHTAYLKKEAAQGRVTVKNYPGTGYKEIVTGVQVLDSAPVSRCQVQLYTGRTHQIRAHLAFLGHPLLGDDLYGDRAWNKEQKAARLYLHHQSLTLHGLQGALAYLNERSFHSPCPF